MSVNKYKLHLLVLPEDDANRQIANGFLLNPTLNNRAVCILPPAAGWLKAIELFRHNHLAKMRKYEKRMFILLIDFDRQENRLDRVQKEVPADLRDRVFIIGSRSEPEDLKKRIDSLNSLEEIGKALAEDCVNETDRVWGHNLLKHNKGELDRLRIDVKPFLFG